jgi:hypothetical protein
LQILGKNRLIKDAGRGLRMYISSKGIGIRYNDKIDLSTIKRECENWGLSCHVGYKSERVYFSPKDPEKPIEEVVDAAREMVRHLDGLEWDK